MTVIFGFDFVTTTVAGGGSSGRSVRRGATGGLYGAGDDVQIWCVLLFGSELSLVAGRPLVKSIHRRV